MLECRTVSLGLAPPPWAWRADNHTGGNGKAIKGKEKKKKRKRNILGVGQVWVLDLDMSEAGKRNLPPWMNKGESSGGKPSEESDESEKPKQGKGHHRERDLGAKEMESTKKSASFSKLLVMDRTGMRFIMLCWFLFFWTNSQN